MTPLLKAGKTNLVPEIMRNIQTFAWLVMDVTHDGDRGAAAMSLVPRLGIQRPKNTLIKELVGLLPNRYIIGPPTCSITLKTRLDEA